ncbi:MAG: DNA polymerase I [Sphaerochaetaceae bacterium]|nr:DNA polymerase I [Sphaerochaetaceae bacterium]
MDLDLFSAAELDQDLLAINNKSKERKSDKETTVKKQEDDRKFSKKIFIIDGYGLIYRSYFAFINRPLLDNNGKNVSAYFGFFNTLFSLFKDYTFDYFVVALDAHGPTFRHEMYPAYKANRDAAPDDLHAQVPLIEETLKKMNIPYIAKVGFEADDLIATLCLEANRHEIDAVMVTGDKDLLQLVNNHVKALRPPKKNQPKYELFGKKEVFEEYHVHPEQIVDYLSLLGDSADNVPGVKGIGEKGAVKLLEEYISLDGIYRHFDSLSKGNRAKLEEGKESAYLSQKLVKLKDDVFTVETFDDPAYLVSKIDYAAGIPEFEKNNCKSLSRSAAALAHGDVKVAINNAEKPQDEESEIKTPQELLGLGSYQTVSDIKVLKALFEEAYRKGGIIAFDTETTDVDLRKAELVGFSFSYQTKKAYYAPLICEGETLLDKSEVIKLFEAYFASGKLKIIGQNVLFDLGVLSKLGVENCRIDFDTMLAAWLLDTETERFNLDFLAGKYLSYETIHYDDIVKKGSTFADVPIDQATRYSSEDSDLAWRLKLLFEPMLEERGLMDVYRSYEIPLIRVLLAMEKEGVLLDMSFMEELSRTLNKREDDLRSDIFALCGHEFNLNSPSQLSKVLFEERGLETGKKTRNGFSTDTSTLEGLKSSGDPIIEKILEYRGVAKLLSTYVETLPTLVDQNGRIHTSYLQTGTATGRLSSRNPNLQNIPIRTDDGRLIRSAFIPKPGYIFLSADYSQVELVVLSHMSGDENLRKAFRDGGDVHRYTASLIFDKSLEEIDPHERRVAKTINFGIIYGMSAFRLAGDLGIPRSKAKEFIDTYFARYSGVSSFIAETVSSAEKNGYVKTLGGHVRRINAINSRNKVEKQAAERVAVNTVIQGTAAEIMKKAMINIYSDMEKEGLESRMLLQVHDELIFEVKAEELERLTAIVRDRMENAVKLSVPLRVGIETGKRWGDMH